MNWKIPLMMVGAIGLAACGDDNDPPAVPGTATIRVAHLSPDAPPVDFCVAPHGTGTFVGPVMEALLLVSEGLAYGQVTTYFEIDEGHYDVRLVAADATTCATGLLPDVTDLPTLTNGLTATIAAIGALVPGDTLAPFEVTAFVDDTTVMMGMAKLRFVHASPNTPNVDVGTGSDSGGNFNPVYTDIPFGGFETAAGFTNGYAEIDPLTDATISARATGTTADAIVLEGIDLPAGAIATAFAIGLLSGEPPLQVLVCVDNGESEDPALTSCTALPPL